MFEKLLIADRGEVVLRIARSCERLGIATIAVHSEADTRAAHASSCDEAVCIDAAPGASAYANAEAIIKAAKQHGAQAIHPGYGALSFSPDFARAVSDACLVFVGPSADALARLADVPATRELARMAGVRVVASAKIDPSDMPAALAAAEEIGYPLRVRTLGREGAAELASDAGVVAEAIERCQAHSASLAGGMYFEHVEDRPRLLAVLVAGDGRGEYVALTDFEHSLHRRGQTVIAESPAPAWTSLPDGMRRRLSLCDCAASIAREANLSGPATAEFLVDADGRISFSRLVAGLPPEHALWEMCTGQDVVELQLRIAAGEALPSGITRAQPAGNAAEAHVYAELPPGGGRGEPLDIKALRWPVVAPGALRIETDLAVGAKSGTDYDPLVGKVIAYGQTRHQALLTLDRVLAEAIIEPLPTNLPFLREILGHESYRAGQYDSEFADLLLAELRAAPR
jgi:acetyl/propionyl-CoA carboxylase alpha subunit